MNKEQRREGKGRRMTVAERQALAAKRREEARRRDAEPCPGRPHLTVAQARRLDADWALVVEERRRQLEADWEREQRVDAQLRERLQHEQETGEQDQHIRVGQACQHTFFAAGTIPYRLEKSPPELDEEVSYAPDPDAWRRSGQGPVLEVVRVNEADLLVSYKVCSQCGAVTLHGPVEVVGRDPLDGPPTPPGNWYFDRAGRLPYRAAEVLSNRQLIDLWGPGWRRA